MSGQLIGRGYITIAGLKDGDPAKTYVLLPSVESVTKKLDGTLSVKTVNCSVYKVTGSSAYALTSDHTVTFVRKPDGQTGTLAHPSGATGNVNILAATESVEFELKDGSKVIDRVRVPVLSDATDVNNELDTYNYLKEALEKQGTTMKPGLMLTSFIAVGYTDDSNVRHTQAGMNGIYVPKLGGRTPAAWYGGPMVDRFNADGTVNNSLAAGSYATSLIRMDGSAYFANGNIRFKNDGTAEFGDTANGYGITLGSNGRLTLGNGIDINIGGEAQGLSASISSVTNLANELSNLFTPFNGNTEETWKRIIEGKATYDNVRVNAGFWTESFVSVKGKNPDGGTSGSGTGSGGAYGLVRTWQEASAEGSDTNSALGANLGYSLYSALTSHTADAISHITAAERAKWNKVVTDFAAITGSDSDSVINKWEEVVNFLATYTEADTLANLLGNKADKTQLTNGSVTKVGTASVGGSSRPIYLNGGTPTACGYTFGNASGNAAVNNGTLNTNLNADMVDGVHAADIDHRRRLFTKADFEHYVVLLWKVNENTRHRISGRLYTNSQGANRYNAADIDLWYSRWGTGNSFDKYFRLDTYGSTSPNSWKLVTCTYNGENWYALQYKATLSIGAFFIGTFDSIAFTAVKYYTSNTSTVNNSEINGSIADKTSELSRTHVGTSPYALTSDNVASATKLQTARAINGTSFDGTANITTSLWGTARNIGIVNSNGTGTAVTTSVNGSANVNLKLPSTIKASLSGNASTATALQTSRTLWGQSFNGGANVSGNMTGVGSVATSHGIANNITDINTAVGTNAYWYGLGLHLPGQNNFVTLGGYFGLKLFTANGMLSMLDNGNVGIGTASPMYRLHVYGRTVIDNVDDYYALWLNKGGVCCEGSNGNVWNNGYGALNVGCFNNTNQTPLVVAYRNGSAAAHTGANRLFAMELLNSGAQLNFAFKGTALMSMFSDGTFYAKTGIWSDGYMSCKGNDTTSDARLKHILGEFSIDIRTIAEAPSVSFAWKDGSGEDVGSIAQYWSKVCPHLSHERMDGMLGLQYGKAALLSVVSVAKATVSIEQRVTELERENTELRSRIAELERR